MFRCEDCNRLSKPGEKPTKLVVETRKQVYTNIVTNKETEEQEVKVSHGTEIVREITVCSDRQRCAVQEHN